MHLKSRKHTQPHTHIAYASKREGTRRLPRVRFLEIGTARIDETGEHVFLDRLPIGGFTGYVRLWPIGSAPPGVSELEDETADAADDQGEESEG
jgi:hypothetical protein